MGVSDMFLLSTILWTIWGSTQIRIHGSEVPRFYVLGNHIEKFASELERSFSRLARDEMGVMALQTAFDRMRYEYKPSNFTRVFSELVSRFARRLSDYTNLVTSTRTLVTQLYRVHKQSPVTPRFECCNLPESDLRLDPFYGLWVSRRKCCDLIPRTLPVSSFNPGHNLTQRFQQQLDYWPNVKWFYFITMDGLHSEFPAHNFYGSSLSDTDILSATFHHPQSAHSSTRAIHQPGRRRSTRVFLPHLKPAVRSSSTLPNIHRCRSLHLLRHRDIFVRSVIVKPIWLVIVLDQGEASQMQLVLGHRVARLLLNSLCEKDRVSLLFASNTITYSSTAVNETGSSVNAGLLLDVRISDFFHVATSEAKSFLLDFIASRRRPLPFKTNHTQALQAAFDVFYNALATVGLDELDSGHLLLAYISRGHLSDLNETGTTLREVCKQQHRVGNRVHIGAYMTVEEKSSTVLFEQTFMNELATKWVAYSSVNGSISNGSSSVQSFKQGQFFAINRTTDLSDTVGKFYRMFVSDTVNEPSGRQHVTKADDSSSTVGDGYSDAHVEVELDTSDVMEDEFNHHLLGGNTKAVAPVQYSLPYRDVEGGDLVLSISQAFEDKGETFGVMGVDLHLSELTDNIVHLSSGAVAGGAGSMSSFIIHAPGGYTVMHPILASGLSQAYSSTGENLGRVHHRLRSRRNSSQHPETSPSGKKIHIESFSRSPAFSKPHWFHAHDDNKDSDVTYHPDYDADRSVLNPDIARLERVPGFLEHVRPLLLSQLTGEIVLNVTLSAVEMEAYGIHGVLMPNDCTSNQSFDSKSDVLPEYRSLRVVYRWHRVVDPPTPFVIVLRVVENHCLSIESETMQRVLVPIVPEFEFHYHRLDLLKDPQSCLYLHQLATFSFGTVFLAPRAFLNPFDRLRDYASGGSRETLPDIRHLLAYLLDSTVLVSDPGLAQTVPSIRSSVAVVERIGKFWNHRRRTSPYRSFIVRRYVAMDTGVMFVYPGTLMPQTFDPTVRSWYRRALTFPDRVVLTGPYLDEGGAGHIVTLSRAIFEGNESGLHRPGQDKVAAVIAIDVTYRFLSLILAKWIPQCGPTLKVELMDRLMQSIKPTDDAIDLESTNNNIKNISSPLSQFASDNVSKTTISSEFTENVTETVPSNLSERRCFLMDDRGHLLAHPEFNELPSRVSQGMVNSHLNFLEPLIATDLITQNGATGNTLFVRKLACLSYADRTVQRLYAFNLSINRVIENQLAGDACIQYQLLPIPKTNLFLGLVNEGNQRFGCSLRTAFCSCHLQDRHCLNCGRLDPHECECPCECPFSVSTVSDWVNASDDLPCPHLLELELRHPPPLASLLAYFAAATGQTYAPPLCLSPDSNRFTRRGNLHGVASDTQPSFLSLSQDDSFGFGFSIEDEDPTGCMQHASQLFCTAAIGCEWCIRHFGRLPIKKHQFCVPTTVCRNQAGILNRGQMDQLLRGQLPDVELSSHAAPSMSQDKWTVGTEHAPLPRKKPGSLLDAFWSLIAPSSHGNEYVYRLIEIVSKRSKRPQPLYSDNDFANKWQFYTSHKRDDSVAVPVVRSNSDVDDNNIVPVAVLLFVTVVFFILLAYSFHHRYCMRSQLRACTPSTQHEFAAAENTTSNNNQQPNMDKQNINDSTNSSWNDNHSDSLPPPPPPPPVELSVQDEHHTTVSDDASSVHPSGITANWGQASSGDYGRTGGVGVVGGDDDDAVGPEDPILASQSTRRFSESSSSEANGQTNGWARIHRYGRVMPSRRQKQALMACRNLKESSHGFQTRSLLKKPIKVDSYITEHTSGALVSERHNNAHGYLIEYNQSIIDNPPNPYHASSGTEMGDNTPASENYSATRGYQLFNTAPIRPAQSTTSEPDSAVGSDGATTASASSSAVSRYAKTRSKLQNNATIAADTTNMLSDPPLGVCIGTLILGPNKQDLDHICRHHPKEKDVTCLSESGNSSMG